MYLRGKLVLTSNRSPRRCCCCKPLLGMQSSQDAWCRVPMNGDNLKFLLLSVAASLTASGVSLSWNSVTVSGLYYRADYGPSQSTVVSGPASFEPLPVAACC